MRIYEILNPKFGRIFKRISYALRKHSPDWVEWVDNEDDADYYFLHTVGGEEYIKFMSLPKGRVINFQHCVFTTSVGIARWENMWKDSALNIAFHDLQSYVNSPIEAFKTPLGADPTTFYLKNLPRTNTVFTTGHVAYTENIDKVSEAVALAGGTMVHTGHNFKYGKHYHFKEYMEDTVFNEVLNQTKYVTGLRSIEGFEAHCIEGAMSGARPIVPDLPTYEAYRDIGIFVDLKSDIVDQLTRIFRVEPVPFSEAEMKYINDTFSWETVVTNIFNEIKRRV